MSLLEKIMTISSVSTFAQRSIERNAENKIHWSHIENSPDSETDARIVESRDNLFSSRAHTKLIHDEFNHQKPSIAIENESVELRWIDS